MKSYLNYHQGMQINFKLSAMGANLPSRGFDLENYNRKVYL